MGVGVGADHVAPGVVVVTGDDVASGIHKGHDAAKTVADGVKGLLGGGVERNGEHGEGEKVVHAGAPGVGEGGDGVRAFAVHDDVVARPNVVVDAGAGAAAKGVVVLDGGADLGDAVAGVPFDGGLPGGMGVFDGQQGGVAEGVVGEAGRGDFVVGVGGGAVAGVEAVAGEVVGLGLGL